MNEGQRSNYTFISRMTYKMIQEIENLINNIDH